MSIVHVPGREEMKTCPYDKSHRVTALKFPGHINKCRRNHEAGMLDTCPYNATHLLRAVDMSAHVPKCPDRLIIERDVTYRKTGATDHCQSGNTQVPTYESDLPEPSENWDQEANTRFGQGYDPSFAMSQVQFRNPNTLSGIKRAEKRAIRKELWGDQDVTSDSVDVVTATAHFSKLRLPKQPPKTLSEEGKKLCGAISGRGRIAAGIYSASSGTQVGMTADRGQLLNTFKSLTIGRGIRSSTSDVSENRPGTSFS